MRFLRWGRGNELPVSTEAMSDGDVADRAEPNDAGEADDDVEPVVADEGADATPEPSLAETGERPAPEPAVAGLAETPEPDLAEPPELEPDDAEPSVAADFGRVEPSDAMDLEAVEPATVDAVAAEVAGTDPDVEPDDATTVDDTSADELARAEAAADIASPSATANMIDTEDAADAADVAPADDEAATDRFEATTEEPDSERVAHAPSEPIEPTGSRRARFVLWEPGAEFEGDPTADGRPAALRFASLHLRGGQHALARAELEALAGRGRLDEPALLDLAEIRWRTGDLAGAGDAANALLARGSESPLALVIAAEAVAAVGRPGEARRLSSRALEVVDGPLDALFAGMPRSALWPAAPEAETTAETPRRRGRNRAGDTSGAPSTASEAFAGGRAALARGDSTRAALLLGVAMRLAPEFAEDVLHAVTGRDDQPLLALVRGDALRLLGREAEALEAFDRARGRASAAALDSPSRAAGPGLFDDDPAISGDEDA